MNPALWGSLCAVNLGFADFMARFSSRAIGPASALFGMLATGAVVLSVYVYVFQPPLVWTWSGIGFVALNGVATTLMTLLLYLGLARGPVSIVAPIVASHPALVVLLAVLLGARPTALQWIAMAGTLAGALIIAACANNFEEAGKYERSHLRTTVLIASASALSYAVLIAAGQAAVPIYGELQTLWLGRLFSLAALVGFFLIRREGPQMTLRWAPFVAAQGLLDAGGYLFLFAGSTGENAEIAAVTASTFGAITTLLAWAVLRERIRLLQWSGIVLVFTCVALLSAHS